MTELLEPPLYRYMRLSSDEDVEHAEDLLLRNRIYYPPMSSFNDPFEGRINFSFEATEQEKVAHVARIIQRRLAIPYNDAKAQAPERIELNEKEGADRVRGLILNDWGVCCLSRSKNDIRMWSHYTDGHKGICIEFAATRLDHVEFFGTILPVHYTDQMPCVNEYKTPRHEKPKRAILTKSSQWNHEQECRAIVTDISEENPRDRELPSGIISGVYLGARITDENRRRVLAWAFECESPVTVYQARLQSREYGLAFDLVRRCCAKKATPSTGASIGDAP